MGHEVTGRSVRFGVNHAGTVGRAAEQAPTGGWGLTIAPSVLAVLTRLLSEHLHGSVCRAEKSGAPWDRFVADSAPEVDPSTGSSPTDALGEIVSA
jgi:hypothetical protein